MSDRALATTQKAASTSAAPAARGFLQRKCACGTHTTGGECEECKKTKLVLQRKLIIGTSDDPLEREADRAANLVTAGRQYTPIGNTMSRVQRFAGTSAGSGDVVSPTVERELANPGTPLQSDVREEMEQKFGYDFSRVRVHTGSAAAQSARDIDSNAYAVGHHIVFGAGRLAPATPEGRWLIAHELAHVVQQSGTESSRLGPVGEIRGLSPTTPGIIQRQRRGSAGGCGICLNNEKAAGKIAHTEIQAAFIANNPSIAAEDPVPVTALGEPAPFRPKADLSYVTHEHGESIIYIGEIKPLDDDGKEVGIARKQLQDYARELNFTYDHVFNMRDAPPALPVPFLNPFHPPGCPPQLIHVRRTEPGIYQYYCEPPFSELVKDPRCKCRPRDEDERKRDKVRVPVPLSPPLTSPNSQTEEQSKRQRPGLQGPAPTPAPMPAPVPGSPTPETQESEGGKVIPIRRPAKPSQEDQPQEQPLAAKEKFDWKQTILILVAAAVVYIGKKLLQAASKSGKGGPILAVIQLVAAAAVIALSQRQAKAGENKTDDDPLVALAEMLDDSGQKMPPEIRKLLEENPELRELIRIEVERRRRMGGSPVSGAPRGSPSSTPKTAGDSKGTEPVTATNGVSTTDRSASKADKGINVDINKSAPTKTTTPEEKKLADVASEHLKRLEGLARGNQQIPLPQAPKEYEVGKIYDLGLAGRDPEGILYLGIVPVKIVEKKGNQWTISVQGGGKLYTYGRVYGTTKQTTNIFTYAPRTSETRQERLK